MWFTDEVDGKPEAEDVPDERVLELSDSEGGGWIRSFDVTMAGLCFGCGEGRPLPAGGVFVEAEAGGY